MNYNFARSIFNKLNNTPIMSFKIAHSMVDLLNDTDFFKEQSSIDFDPSDYAEHHRVLDISCKSGSILMCCYYRFRVALQDAIPSIEDRDYYIWRFLLFAFVKTRQLRFALSKYFYHNLKYDMNYTYGNIFVFDVEKYIKDKNKDEVKDRDKDDSEIVLKEVLKMKFDVIVGNPPYSTDIKFIKMVKSMSNLVLMITSASYYSQRNRDESLLDNLRYCKYFPMSYDVFPSVKQLDGLCISLWDKTYNGLPKIENYWSCFPVFNTKKQRSLKGTTPIINFGYDLVTKINAVDSLKLNVKKIMSKNYCVRSTDAISCFADYRVNDSSSHYITSPVSITSNNSDICGHYVNLYESDSYFECQSFKSYIETRLIRFLIMLGVYSLNSYTNHGFRFVPNPVSFDMIYEDNYLDGYNPDNNGEYIDANGVKHCSLYVKYKLTKDEINIIESVIKERK